MPRPSSKRRRPRLHKVPGRQHTYTHPLDRTLTNMRAFWRATDWSDWWTEWFQAIEETGRRKYKSIAQFVRDKAQSKEQYHFLTWYLGPPPEEGETDDEAKKHPFVPGPMDWLKKREEGGWFTAKNLDTFTAEIRRRENVLDAMQETGRRITLGSVARAEQLAQRIDAFFHGEILIEGLSFEQNEKRADLYLKLHAKVMGLQERAFVLFAKSHGVNFDDMAGLVQLMQASAMSTAQKLGEGKAVSREAAAVHSLVEMTLVKAAKYKLPLPSDAEATLVEAAGEYEVSAGKKKRNLQ